MSYQDEYHGHTITRCDCGVLVGGPETKAEACDSCLRLDRLSVRERLARAVSGDDLSYTGGTGEIGVALRAVQKAVLANHFIALEAMKWRRARLQERIEEAEQLVQRDGLGRQLAEVNLRDNLEPAARAQDRQIANMEERLAVRAS